MKREFPIADLRRYIPQVGAIDPEQLDEVDIVDLAGHRIGLATLQGERYFFAVPDEVKIALESDVNNEILPVPTSRPGDGPTPLYRVKHFVFKELKIEQLP